VVIKRKDAAVVAGFSATWSEARELFAPFMHRWPGKAEEKRGLLG
jgi:hypothetical protein